MIKEIIAASILIVLIVLSLFNISFVEHKTETLKADVEKAQVLLNEGKPDEALECLSSSLSSWEDYSKYAGVMLRHSDEITEVSNSYYEVMTVLETTGSVSDILFEKLKHVLTDIADVESLSMSSLF